jgi:hypothetical protein
MYEVDRKFGMDLFENLKDSLELSEYLRNLNERYENKKDKIILSHYTNISTLLNILRMRSLWLGDYRKMNDSFENALMNKNKYARNFYYSCFSLSEESLAMYKMYGDNNPDSTIIMQISLSTFMDMMSYSCNGEHAGGVDDDGKYPQFQRKLNIIRDNVETSQKIDASIYGVEIAYLDPLTGVISLGDKTNENIISPLMSEDLVGLIKFKCWDYEREIRLCAYTSEPLDENEKIALKLPDDICKKIKIILGPGFDADKYREALYELSFFGVKWQDSIYSKFYTNLTKGQWGVSFPENTFFISEYLNYIFEGQDPWGEKLSVEITDYKNNFISWKWVNTIEIDGGTKEIEINESSFLGKDLVFHFNIYKKLDIYEDKNEFYEYAYSGAVLLSNEKLLISFNDGQCCSFVYGGSGVDYYEYGGTGRNGINLLSVLEKI